MTVCRKYAPRISKSYCFPSVIIVARTRLSITPYVILPVLLHPLNSLSYPYVQTRLLKQQISTLWVIVLGINTV
jgi:hypothetical protein